MEYSQTVGTREISRAVATLGLLGIILSLAGYLIELFILQYVGSFIGTIGTLLLIVSYFKLGFEWDDTEIKKYAGLFVFFIAITGLVMIISIVVIALFIKNSDALHLVVNNRQVSWQGLWTVVKNMGFKAIVLGVVTYVLLIFVGFSFYKLYDRIGKISGIKEFITTGKLYLFGILSLPILVGIALLLVSYAYHIIAWAKARTRTK